MSSLFFCIYFFYTCIIQRYEIFRFSQNQNYSDFARVQIVYNKTMAILDNDRYPLFETESSSGEIKIFSDCCSHGCACQTSSDHDTEFVQDVIDFEQ